MGTMNLILCGSGNSCMLDFPAEPVHTLELELEPELKQQEKILLLAEASHRCNSLKTA